MIRSGEFDRPASSWGERERDREKLLLSRISSNLRAVKMFVWPGIKV